MSSTTTGSHSSGTPRVTNVLGITVPLVYSGPGKSKSQISVQVAATRCVGYVAGGVFPKIDSGRTPIHVTVRGLDTTAAHFVYSRTLLINNAGDPSIAAGKRGPVHFGRYVLDVRFAGDGERLPSTLRRTEVIPGSKGC